MKTRPTKVVIPVAGYGTRRLPITKTIEKCMLPILNRLIVDYIAQDCIRAGLTDILFVVSDDATQLQSYYGKNIELEKYLISKGKEKEYDIVKNCGGGASISYVIQPRDKYGTAVPLAVAKKFMGSSKNFVVLMGDDFVVRYDNESSIGTLIDDWQQNIAEHAMLGVEIPASETYKYGVLKVDKNSHLQEIVEKPLPKNAPSNMINVSKYIFDKSIIDFLDTYMSQDRKGEYMLTDVMNMALDAGQKICVGGSHGQFLDGGELDGWLFANNYLRKIYSDRL